MRLMPIYQKPNTSKPRKGHKTYPYLLGGLRVDRPGQVWCADITYLPARSGPLYLSLVTDAYSRKIVGHHVHEGMHAESVAMAFKKALKQ